MSAKWAGRTAMVEEIVVLPTTLQLTTHCKKTTDPTGGAHYTTSMSIRLPVSFLSFKTLFERQGLFFSFTDEGLVYTFFGGQP